VPTERNPSAAQLLDDVVVRDRLADHWAEILWLKEGQVNEGEEVGCILNSQLAKNRHFTN
jgi:hypothetical protein